MNKSTPDSGRVPSLEEIELEVETEAREFARRRLQERLQQLADARGGVFPPGRTRSAKAPSGANAPCADFTAPLN